MDALTRSDPLPAVDARSRNARWLTAIAVALILICLGGRILTYPIQHDEQFYLPPGLLLGELHLYRDIGFTHMPNLPLVLAMLDSWSGAANVLLVGRLLVAASWIALLYAIYRTGRSEGAGQLAIATAGALLLFNSNLLEEPGMAATNNFVPMPFAVAGLALFFAATRNESRAPMLAAASGLLLSLAAGFKANFAPLILPVVIAALLVPQNWPVRRRLLGLALPMSVGGIIGGLPTLYYLAGDPQGFLACVLQAHQGPQIGYWLANPSEPRVMGLSGKLILARSIWLGGTALLMLVAIAVLVLLLSRQERGWRNAATAAGWQGLLLVTLIGIAAVIAFLPTPAFPQYYILPLPFGAMLLLFLHGRLNSEQRETAQPVLLVALALGIVNGAPSLLSKGVGLATPGEWASTKLRDDASAIAAAMRSAAVVGKTATLEPLQPLAGNMEIYPELALGHFIYRAAEWMPAEQRRHFRFLASPQSIEAVLAADPPAAVIVGGHGKLDVPMERFARSHNYREVVFDARSGGKIKKRTLFLAPARAAEP